MQDNTIYKCSSILNGRACPPVTSKRLHSLLSIHGLRQVIRRESYLVPWLYDGQLPDTYPLLLFLNYPDLRIPEEYLVMLH